MSPLFSYNQTDADCFMIVYLNPQKKEEEGGEKEKEEKEEEEKLHNVTNLQVPFLFIRTRQKRITT